MAVLSGQLHHRPPHKYTRLSPTRHLDQGATVHCRSSGSATVHAEILTSHFMSIYNDTSQFGVEDNCGCSQGDSSRTVIEIIWSCFITILSCTWVSMHTNIPHPDATDWQVWRDRLYLTIAALVAPEIIVLWAMRQWIGARLLSKEFEGIALG